MAGAVSAQSANVTLYGVLDVFVANERVSGGPAGRPSASATVVESGGLSGSRWGLRGSESLGGGLNAVFVAESGFNADTGAMGQGGLLFGRQVFVGLNGGFGSFTMGRQYSPMFSVLCEVDIDGCSTYSVVSNHYVNLLPGALRVNNAVVYSTPNMGGLTASAMWGAGESAVGTNAGRTLSANAQYKAGPLYAALAYVDVKAAGSTANAGRTWIAAGGFDAGVAKLTASYLENKFTFGTAKFKGFQVGASVPFGATTMIVNAGQGKVGAGKNTIFNIGADHSLSKRTTAYARYAVSNNNDSLNVGAFTGVVSPTSGGATAAQSLGRDERVLAIGVRHRF